MIETSAQGVQSIKIVVPLVRGGDRVAWVVSNVFVEVLMQAELVVGCTLNPKVGRVIYIFFPVGQRLRL